MIDEVMYHKIVEALRNGDKVSDVQKKYNVSNSDIAEIRRALGIPRRFTSAWVYAKAPKLKPGVEI